MSELALYDPTMGVATSADLLCLDERGRIVLVENKTGYYSSWRRACHEMSGPFSRPISDSPCNQSLMQLMFTKRMIEGYGVHVDRAFTLRVDPDGVVPYPLPISLEEDADVLAAHVADVQWRKPRQRR